MLVVLRGNSGSGKSTVARALQEALPGAEESVADVVARVLEDR